MFAVVFGILMALWVSFGAQASSMHVVTLYVDGQKQVISTNLNTVADVLDKADVHLGNNDLVEPALDTKLVDGSSNVNVYRSRPIQIVDEDSEPQTVMSPHQSPRLIAEAAGLEVYPEDDYTLERVDDFTNNQMVGLRLNIQRAKKATVYVDNKELTLRAQAETVNDFLDAKGILIGEKDTVTPALDSHLEDGAEIQIIRVGEEMHIKEEVIKRQTRVIYDSGMAYGLQEVKNKGKDGVRLTTYYVIKENGKVVDKRKINEEVATKPVDRVVVRGTNKTSMTEYVDLAKDLAANRGWTGSQWNALYRLWEKEAHFNPWAVNPTSGACGITQALPCSKMGPVNRDGTSAVKPAGQIEWGLDYIARRYNTPVEAYEYWKCTGYCTNNYGTIYKTKPWY